MPRRGPRAANLLAALLLLGWVAACTNNPRPVTTTGPPDGVDVIGTVPPLTSGVLPVDVIIEDRLYHADRDIALDPLLACAPSCRVQGAARVPDGWLVSVYHHNAPASPDLTTFWHVPESGEAAIVVEGQGLVVARGTAAWPGVKVAWVADGRLRVGTYADGGLTGVVSTPAPVADADDPFGGRPLYPQVVAGGAVVLAGTRTGGGLDLWDVWFPSRGDYVPEAYPVIGLYGVTADGERLLAWYHPDSGSKEGCLGELDPDDFEPVRSVCPAPFPDYADIYPSPGGQWWIVLQDGRVDLYDADQVWSGGAPVRSLPALGIWVDPTSFIVLDGPGTIVGYTDGRPDQPLPQTVPGQATPSSLVLDLRDGF